MKIGVFTLPEVLMKKDPNTIINDRYPFVNGKMEVVETVARQIERTLCVMYQCKLTWIDASPVVDKDAPTGSLAKIVTQPNVRIQPPVESKLASEADVHAKPVEGGPKSVTSASVQDGIKAAEIVKAMASEAKSPVAANVSATVTTPAKSQEKPTPAASVAADKK